MIEKDALQLTGERLKAFIDRKDIQRKCWRQQTETEKNRLQNGYMVVQLLYFAERIYKWGN